MSKGYTLVYFIKMFQDIPTHLIVTADKVGKKSKTVEGHLAHKKTGLPTAKSTVLYDFLYGHVNEIAEGKYNYSTLGKTPKTRLLKALKLRKQGTFCTFDYIAFPLTDF